MISGGATGYTATIIEITDPYNVTHVYTMMSNGDSSAPSGGTDLKSWVNFESFDKDGKTYGWFQSNNFQLMDLTDPFNPLVVATKSASTVPATGWKLDAQTKDIAMFKVGDNDYLMSSSFNFQLIDLSDPTNPVPAGWPNPGMSWFNVYNKSTIPRAGDNSLVAARPMMFGDVTLAVLIMKSALLPACTPHPCAKPGAAFYIKLAGA